MSEASGCRNVGGLGRAAEEYSHRDAALRIFLGLGLAVAASPGALRAGTALWMPALFGDHMVVQAGRPVRVWGRDLPGTALTLRLAGESAVTRADAEGRWTAELAPLKSGEAAVLEVVGSSTRTFQDVLAGEVWLGAGQSNMELALRATRDRNVDIPKAADQGLRLFTVDRVSAFRPLDDVQGRWRVCTPECAAEFSAVAYYFGRDLRASLGCPVGLIVASWGGTPGEDWVPRPALDAHEPYRSLAADWDRAYGQKALWSDGENFDLEVKDLRLVPAQGTPMDLPLAGWEHYEKPGSTGAVSTAGGELRYRGRVHASAWATVNRALFAPGSDAPVDTRPYERVAFMARGKGSYTLALGQPTLRDADLYASTPFDAGPQWKPFSVPLASLRQGGWGEPVARTPQSVTQVAFNVQVPFWPQLGGVAYNGMIAPLVRFPLRGVLWYQGESNVGRAGQYAGLLRLLVDSWRQAWGSQDLAFLTVQLPGYGDTDPASGPTWAQLRQAQQQAMDGLAHAGLAVTLDLGEAHTIHPGNKRPVGQRLALLARALVYGQTVEADGPEPTVLSPRGSSLCLDFRHAIGLVLRGPAGFEVAGRDGVFHAASARLEGEHLLFSSPQAPEPRAVRYAWADDPTAVLYNGAGLPAAPFSVELK